MDTFRGSHKMEDTSTLEVTVADITAREGIEHAVTGGHVQ